MASSSSAKARIGGTCAHEEAFAQFQELAQATVHTLSTFLGTQILMELFGSCRAGLCNCESDVDVLIYFSNTGIRMAGWDTAWRQTCFGFVAHSLLSFQENGHLHEVVVIPEKFTVALSCAETRFDVHVDGCRGPQHTYIWTGEILKSSFTAQAIGFRTQWLDLLRRARAARLVQSSGAPRGKMLKGVVFSLLIAAASENCRVSSQTTSCADVLLRLIAELKSHELCLVPLSTTAFQLIPKSSPAPDEIVVRNRLNFDVWHNTDGARNARGHVTLSKLNNFLNAVASHTLLPLQDPLGTVPQRLPVPRACAVLHLEHNGNLVFLAQEVKTSDIEFTLQNLGHQGRFQIYHAGHVDQLGPDNSSVNFKMGFVCRACRKLLILPLEANTWFCHRATEHPSTHMWSKKGTFCGDCK